MVHEDVGEEAKMQPTQHTPEYLMTKQVTQRFGLSWDYLRKSGLNCYRVSHRIMLWKVSDIVSHIDARKTVAA